MKQVTILGLSYGLLAFASVTQEEWVIDTSNGEPQWSVRTSTANDATSVSNTTVAPTRAVRELTNNEKTGPVQN